MPSRQTASCHRPSLYPHRCQIPHLQSQKSCAAPSFGVGQGDYPISAVVAQLLGKGQEAGIEARANSPVLKHSPQYRQRSPTSVIGCPAYKGEGAGISGNFASFFTNQIGPYMPATAGKLFHRRDIVIQKLPPYL